MPAKSFREHLGIAPSTATTADSVLVIIDAQNEYASGILTVANLATTRLAIAQLLERYRAAGGAVVHVWHVAPEGAPVFTPNTPLADAFSELAPQSGESIVKKHFPGAFAETNLQDIIQNLGVRKIVLVGYMAHICVSTTAREAHQRKYEVVVVKDAVGDRDIPGASGEAVTEMVMLELADGFATVVKSEEMK
ncbi:Isochorismatase-like protein [Mycena capillaripes]|nr:Isochorismatase-like protein [Mycena capillaripes]